MDPQLTALVQALAWHAVLQTYLLIALAALTVLGFVAIARELRAVGRIANAIATRLER